MKRSSDKIEHPYITFQCRKEIILNPLCRCSAVLQETCQNCNNLVCCSGVECNSSFHEERKYGNSKLIENFCADCSYVLHDKENEDNIDVCLYCKKLIEACMSFPHFKTVFEKLNTIKYNFYEIYYSDEVRSNSDLKKKMKVEKQSLKILEKIQTEHRNMTLEQICSRLQKITIWDFNKYVSV